MASIRGKYNNKSIFAELQSSDFYFGLVCVSCRHDIQLVAGNILCLEYSRNMNQVGLFRGKPIDATKLKRNNLYTCIWIYLFFSRSVFFCRSNFCKMVFHICCDVDGFYNLLFHRPNKFSILLS
jgi:hypothetical protein